MQDNDLHDYLEVAGTPVSRRALLVRAGQLGVSATVAAAVGASGAEARTTAVAKAAGAGKSMKSGGTLLAAVGSEPDTLDPQKSALAAAAEVYDNIFSKLVALDRSGNILPQLATSWTVSHNRLSWIFDLRDDVVFHNGQKFTGEDVKYSIERLLNPKTAAAGAINFQDIARVDVLSPTKVAFRLAKPYSPLLTTLANTGGQIVNKKAIEASGSARAPVGTGPFKFVDWVTGSHVSVVKNPHYFEPGLPYLNAVTFSWPEVTSQRLNDLQSGVLNWVDQVPPQLLGSVKANRALKTVTSNDAGLPEFLALNLTKPPLNNQALRQAIAWAIDRDEIRRLAFSGVGQNGSEELPTGSDWYTDNDPYKDGPDLDRARSYMKKSGLSNVDITFAAWTAAPYPTTVGEIVKQQLAPLGINVTVEPQELSAWITGLLGKQYEMTIAFHEGTVDPNDFYSIILVSNSSQNVTGYKNAKFDALVSEARGAASMATRKQLYGQIRELVFTDVPLFFLHYQTEAYVMQSRVQGSLIRPNLELGFQYVGYDR